SARIVLRVRQSFFRFARRARQHRDAVPRAGEDGSGAGSHRPVRADNYDLVVVGQVTLRVLVWNGVLVKGAATRDVSRGRPAMPAEITLARCPPAIRIFVSSFEA